MRDGDGDGRCKEEGDKWVPCPPGVAPGTRLRNGKPLGQTIADITQAPQPSRTPSNPYSELMASRKISERELNAVAEGADLTAWRYSIVKNLPSMRDIPGGTRMQFSQALREEYRRVRQLANEERNKQYRRDFPELFDENGQIKKEKIKEYLDARRRRAREFADRVAAAKAQVSPRSIAAARSVNYDEIINDTGDITDEERALLERQFEARNPRPLMSEYSDENEFRYEINQWSGKRDRYVFSEINSGIATRRRAAQDSIAKAFEHQFTSLTGRRFKTEADVMMTSGGYTIVRGTVWEVDDNGFKLNAAGSYEREIDPQGKVVNHKVMRTKPAYEGEGIATTVNALNEAIYKELGMERISLYGVSNSTDNRSGGYSGASHWAANGFNWEDGGDRQEFLSAIREAVYRGDDSLFSSPQQRIILRELLQAAEDQAIDAPDALTASDFTGWPGITQFFKDQGVSLHFSRDI